MQLKFYPYTLKLKQSFTISTYSRLTTPAVLVEIEHDGIIGYGEASLPPYLKENQSSVINFLNRIDFSEFTDLLQLKMILDYVDQVDNGNYAAKAAIDIALHDLVGKLLNTPLYRYLNITKKDAIYSSYTLGISDSQSLKEKITEASQFKFFKVKLGTKDDKKIIKRIRSLTEKPLFVDVNQGWNDKYYALEMINWLKERNVILIEQPLSKEKIEETCWLTERSPLPIIADEAAQQLEDLDKIRDAYSGVNIKLMKAGGIRHAFQMINRAMELKLKVMMGCMTETSCANTAASHLSPLADWVDLDGAVLISNDLFTGMLIKKGAVSIPNLPGLGVEKITK